MIARTRPEGATHVHCRFPLVRGRVGEGLRTRGSWLRPRVRRLAAATALGVALMAVVAAPGALAVGQQHERFHDFGTDVDLDFCGTGQRIDIAFDVWVNAFHAPNQGLYKETARGKVTFTNPLTGDIVILRFANTILEVLVEGELDGLHVVDTAVKGLPELIKTPHGGVLTRDAGYIVFRNSFDGDELVSSEIVVNKGPHPNAESDFELFCEIMPEALGI
jgi:hypothetical protein